ncbi:hypothetical protein QA597_08725 [Marinilabiliaceae bacterium ANBcel2]|nr:hypothetical protein [Marinilabiliaceae bacterium ANBcel2]
MNKQFFTDAIEGKAVFDHASLDLLKTVLDEYPFFEAGRMLWIKNLHQLNHIKYNNELKVAAAHITDRARLYQLVYSKNEELYEQFNHKDCSSEVTSQKEDEELSASESEESSGAYFEVSDIYECDNKESTSFRFDVPDEDVDNLVLPSADLLDYERSSETVYTILPDGDELNEESRSFSEWLNVLRYHSPGESSKVEQKDREATAPKMDLIDSFLERGAPGKILPGSDSERDKEDKAAPSLQENDDLMTETLADIYIKQNNFLKAIEIFERLRLKYPEKNIYFARRIKELEEKQ